MLYAWLAFWCRCGNYPNLRNFTPSLTAITFFRQALIHRDGHAQNINSYGKEKLSTMYMDNGLLRSSDAQLSIFVNKHF